MVGVWLILTVSALSAFAQAGDTVSLLSDCGNPEESVATVRNTDHVQVRYSLAGYSQTCYVVIATVNGTPTQGYLLGADHPDVAAFEKEARSHIPAIPDPPKPEPAPDATKEAAPRPDLPKSFAGLSGTSPKGARVSLDSMGASTVVLYFWSAADRNSIRESSQIETVYNLYSKRGVAVVGVVSAANATQARRVLSEEEVLWPQILDSGGEITAKYPATKEIRYYVLDRQRNVVATAKSANDVVGALSKLRKQGASE